MKFRKDDGDEMQSILGEGVEFDGELSFSHGLRVDGVVRGRINSDACLIIGPAGRVEAEAHIRRAFISGEFRGAIYATDRIEVHKEGKVYGDLYTSCLIIEAGAIFDGKCNMAEEGAGKTAEKSLKLLDGGGEGVKIADVPSVRESK